MKQWCLFTSQVRTRIPAEGMGSRTAYRIAFIQYHVPKCLNMSGCDTVRPTHSFSGKVPLGRSSHKTLNPCVSKLRPHGVSQEVGFTSEFCLLLSMSVWVFPYSLLMKINLFFFFWKSGERWSFWGIPLQRIFPCAPTLHPNQAESHRGGFQRKTRRYRMGTLLQFRVAVRRGIKSTVRHRAVSLGASDRRLHAVHPVLLLQPTPLLRQMQPKHTHIMQNPPPGAPGGGRL